MTYLVDRLYCETIATDQINEGDVIALPTWERAYRVDEITARPGGDRTARLGGMSRRIPADARVWRALKTKDGVMITTMSANPGPRRAPADIIDMRRTAARSAISAFLAARDQGDPDRIAIMEGLQIEAMERYAEAACLSHGETLAECTRISNEILAEWAARTPTHRIDVRYLPKATDDDWQSSGRDMTPVLVKADEGAGDAPAINEAMRIVWDGRGAGWTGCRVTVVRLDPDGHGEIVFEYATPDMAISPTAGRGFVYV